MKECRDIFYNGELLNKLDTNPYTIGFNSVYDFEEKNLEKVDQMTIFLSTNMNYKNRLSK